MTLEIFVEPSRDSEDFLRFEELMEKLGWDTYPTHVTGEELDAGCDSDEARSQTIECPSTDVDILNFLDERGVFDDL